MTHARTCFGTALALLALLPAPLRAQTIATTRPAAAAAVPAPKFMPQGTTKGVRQVQATFASPMVALGDPRLPSPFSVECAATGIGRWVDARHWVYDFDADLPGGLRCKFTLRRALADLAGHPVTGTKPFVFDTGGPQVVASLPAEGHESIDEHQVFLLKLDTLATPDSVRAHARCLVEGLGEALPVTLLEGAEREAVLAQRRKLGYAYHRLLWQDRDMGDVGVRGPAFEAAEKTVATLRCQRPLPPGATVQLLWGRGIAAASSGLATQQDQALAFRVRPAFTARVECSRVNPDAGCLPIRPIDVRFTAPVPRELALQLRLSVDGASRVPRPLDRGSAPMLEGVRFDGPFEPSSSAKITVPAGLVDDAGRALGNAARFPLDVRVDEYPPLAKFAGTFGILEANEGGVLPVTLRNLDPTTGPATTASIPARRLRVGADPAALAAWLRRVDKASEPKGDWQKDPKTGRSRWRELTGAASVFETADSVEDFAIAKPGGAREFEVVGIPLGARGLHVVELQSRLLGRSLLGEDRPRHVVTAALVTNLAVHFKWGRESSIAWVTTLDRGEPVPDADVKVAGYCDGKVRWNGRTDRDGIVRIATPLGSPGSSTYCGDAAAAPLMVLATLGDDFGFVLSSWAEGIAPWDFGLPTAYGASGDLFHTVFDRPLFRPGETVSMKHFLRRHGASGLSVQASLPAPRKVAVQHSGSDQRYESSLDFDALGIAAQQWTIPPGARNGDYVVHVANARGEWQQSGTFKVEDFRLPTMRAAVSGPAKPLVQPARVPVDVHVAYLAGGGASGLPVTLRSYVEPRLVQFRDYEDYAFGGAAVREGLETLGQAAEDAANDAELGNTYGGPGTMRV